MVHSLASIPTPEPDVVCRAYLCRHGRTGMNARGVVQGGAVDEPLDETGRLQAEALAKAFLQSGLRPDVVVTSGLARSVLTGAALRDWNVAADVQEDNRFNEMLYGDLEGAVLSDAETKRRIGSVVKAWMKGDRHHVCGGASGESYDMVARRSRQAFEEVLEKQRPKALVVVSHSRLAKVLITDVLGLGPERMETIPLDNCGVIVLDVVEDAPGGPYRYRTVALNVTAHL
ncbi:2-carboxy-D-arabinitol-1-phosphatase [Diplonema papillatum]|nr:2-carboxy-D-arabinitol-1-phosphatase [Diplonema papillatum]